MQQRFESPGVLLGDRLRGVYRLLAEHGDRLFPDDYFADLYKASRLGRPTVPARVLATVMVLQAQEGLSDQEACDRLECDLRWQAAAGVDAGYVAFHPTVLVGQRNRLRALGPAPAVLGGHQGRGPPGRACCGDRARVLDSTPIYDAVATQDTVTQLRAAIRKLLRALAGTALAGRVRAGPGPRRRLRQRRASRPATGTTPPPGSSWSTSWSATPGRRWPPWRARRWRGRRGRRRSCWRWSPARTSRPARTGCSASPAGSPRIG